MSVTMEYTERAGQAVRVNLAARKSKNFSLEASGKSTLEALKSWLVLLLFAKIWVKIHINLISQNLFAQ